MQSKPSKSLVITTDRYDLAWEIDQLAQVPGIEISLQARTPHTEDDLIEMARDADVLMSSSRDPVSRRVIENLSRCALIGRYSVGYDQIDVDAATEHGIIVTHVPDYCTAEVADHAMSLILALNRRIVELDRDLHGGAWLEHAHYTRNILRGPVHPLRHQTLGIVGFGRIGKSVAARAKPFGLRIIASDPYIDDSVFSAAGVERFELDHLLRTADIITLHTLLNVETHHLIDAPRIGLLKPGALIVNTSRGPIIDLDALAAALESGAVAGAGLDVVDPEPLPMTSPLYRLPSVILTPHSAYYSDLSVEIVRREALAEAIRVLRGMRPRTVANPAVQPRVPLSPYTGPAEPGACWRSETGDEPDCL